MSARTTNNKHDEYTRRQKTNETNENTHLRNVNASHGAGKARLRRACVLPRPVLPLPSCVEGLHDHLLVARALLLRRAQQRIGHCFRHRHSDGCGGERVGRRS